MLTLFLCRHAKSSWDEPGLSDKERPLNPRGKIDAPLMGKMLKNNDEKADLCISSPARRALKTAKLIADEINYSRNKIITETRLYMADIDDFIEVIEEYGDKNGDNNKSIMLFSHNYGITEFANFISASEIDNIPTCGIVKIRFKCRQWKNIRKEKGKAEYFIYPKMYKHGI